MAREWHQEHDDDVYVYADVLGMPLHHVVFSGGGELKLGTAAGVTQTVKKKEEDISRGQMKCWAALKNTQKQGCQARAVRGAGRAKEMPLGWKGQCIRTHWGQRTQTWSLLEEFPRAEEGDLMPRSSHLTDPTPAYCRQRIGTHSTHGTRFCDAAGLPPARRPPGSQVLSDAAIPGTVVVTLVSSSSCLFSSSSCWVRACLPLVSCETSTSFSSTWWLSSPNAGTWPRSALRLLPHGPPHRRVSPGLTVLGLQSRLLHVQIVD